MTEPLTPDQIEVGRLFALAGFTAEFCSTTETFPVFERWMKRRYGDVAYDADAFSKLVSRESVAGVDSALTLFATMMLDMKLPGVDTPDKT